MLLRPTCYWDPAGFQSSEDSPKRIGRLPGEGCVGGGRVQCVVKMGGIKCWQLLRRCVWHAAAVQAAGRRAVQVRGAQEVRRLSEGCVDCPPGTNVCVKSGI